MEALPFIILLVLILLGLPTVLVIWLIVRAADARNRIGELSRKVDWLEWELLRLKRNPPVATAETKTDDAGRARQGRHRPSRRRKILSLYRPHRRPSHQSQSSHRNQSFRQNRSM